MEKAEDFEISEVLPSRAFEMLRDNKNTVLLDVRSKMEFDYVGHPTGAVNVPWQSPPAWQLNPDFLDQVKQALGIHLSAIRPEEALVLTLCRSGKRSFDAATFLKESGFSRVTNIAEGFEGDLDENKHRGNVNGWRFYGLPWEQT